eukprot:3370903-Heterocapsa_arctica.AAC.1
MVIARMPEDRSNPFKNIQRPSKALKAIHTCMCTPVGRTGATLPFTLFSDPFMFFSDPFTFFSDPFTFLSDPLYFSGSKCHCASDGDSESSPR